MLEKKNKILSLVCKTDPEKTLWLAEFKRAIDEATSKQDKVQQKAKELQMKEWVK
jgi:hypothetical protein